MKRFLWDYWPFLIVGAAVCAGTGLFTAVWIDAGFTAAMATRIPVWLGAGYMLMFLWWLQGRGYRNDKRRHKRIIDRLTLARNELLDSLSALRAESIRDSHTVHFTGGIVVRVNIENNADNGFLRQLRVQAHVNPLARHQGQWRINGTAASDLAYEAESWLVGHTDRMITDNLFTPQPPTVPPTEPSP